MTHPQVQYQGSTVLCLGSTSLLATARWETIRVSIESTLLLDRHQRPARVCQLHLKCHMLPITTSLGSNWSLLLSVYIQKGDFDWRMPFFYLRGGLCLTFLLLFYSMIKHELVLPMINCYSLLSSIVVSHLMDCRAFTAGASARHFPGLHDIIILFDRSHHLITVSKTLEMPPPNTQGSFVYFQA